jgi:dihydropyrimidine dehydrogenase (NAD+) subunit PreA
MALLERQAVKAGYCSVPKDNIICVISDKRLHISEAAALIESAKKETSLKVIANVMGPGEDLDGWVALAKGVEGAGADMIELNMVCTNIGIVAKQLGIKEDGPGELGAALGQNQQLGREVTRAVREAVSIPVMCKLTSEAGGDLPAVAQSCIEGGADCISVIGAPLAIPGVNIYDNGKPLYPGYKTHSFGGLCGKWIRPLALKHLALVSMSLPGVPIAGGGGLSDNVEDTIEFLMLGATATTYCTILMFKGFQVLKKLDKNLRKYMQEMGYNKISDFKGAALKYIKPSLEVDYVKAVPDVDADKCNLCRKCFRLAHCEAISERGGAAYVDLKKCIYCFVCFAICPNKAISIKEGD